VQEAGSNKQTRQNVADDKRLPDDSHKQAHTDSNRDDQAELTKYAVHYMYLSEDKRNTQKSATISAR